MTSSNEEDVDLLAIANEVDQGVMTSNQDVATQAKKVRSRAGHAHQSTQDLLKYLQSSEVREKVLDIQYPPGFDAILEDPTFEDVIKHVMRIAAKYQMGNVNAGEIDRDCLELAAWQMQLGPRVGYAEAQMKHAESTLKLVIARYMLRAKDYQAENPIHLTGPLLAGVAQEAAEDIRSYWGQYLAMAETFKSLYFATKQLIEVMDHCAARLSHEKRLPMEG